MMRQVFWLILVKGLPDSTVALSLTLPKGRIHSYGDSTGFIGITPDFPFDSLRKPYPNKSRDLYLTDFVELSTKCEEFSFVSCLLLTNYYGGKQKVESI